MKNESNKCICVKNDQILARDIDEALNEKDDSYAQMYALFRDMV